MKITVFRGVVMMQAESLVKYEIDYFCDLLISLIAFFII